MNIRAYEQTATNLREKAELPYSELKEIADAFQVASGQAYAIGKTKAILDYMVRHGTLRVLLPSGQKAIARSHELAALLQQLDPSIDIGQIRELEVYFRP